MTFVYVLIEYRYGRQGLFDVRGAAMTEEAAIAWQLSSNKRAYDKWRVA